MWWWFSGSEDDSTTDSADYESDGVELDPDLLAQLGEKWLEDYLSKDDNDTRRVLWEAVEICRREQDGRGR